MRWSVRRVHSCTQRTACASGRTARPAYADATRANQSCDVATSRPSPSGEPLGKGSRVARPMESSQASTSECAFYWNPHSHKGDCEIPFGDMQCSDHKIKLFAVTKASMYSIREKSTFMLPKRRFWKMEQKIGRAFRCNFQYLVAQIEYSHP
jgi:hypothetical protein